jgi:hypothetical protein
MNFIKTFCISLIVAIGVLGVGVGFQKHAPAQTIGAASPDFSSPYISYGDVRHWGARIGSLPTGTSTICSIVSPPATTTLSSFIVRFDTTPGYAQDYAFGVSTTMNATTTIITRLSQPASGNTALVATTSATAIKDGLVGPSTFLSVNLSTSSVGSTFAPTGTCSAGFREI